MPPYLPLRMDFGPPGCSVRHGVRISPHAGNGTNMPSRRYANSSLSNIFGERTTFEAALGHDDEAVRVDGYAQDVLENWLTQNWNTPSAVEQGLPQVLCNRGVGRLNALWSANGSGTVQEAQSPAIAFRFSRLCSSIKPKLP